MGLFYIINSMISRKPKQVWESKGNPQVWESKGNPQLVEDIL